MNILQNQYRLAQVFHLRPMLMSMGFGLACLHLLLIIRIIGNPDQGVLNLLFWTACIVSLWQRRGDRVIQYNRFPLLVGTTLLALLLYKCLNLLPSDSEFIRIFPGVSMFSLALITSGWKLRQYWREGILMLVSMLPLGVIGSLTERLLGNQIKAFITQMAGLVMHYAGTNLLLQGNQIQMSTGVVSVEYACTGIPILIVLLQLTILVLIIFEFHLDEVVQLISGVVLIALILAVTRVVIMASLIQRPEAFDYWHGAAGGQIFSTIGLISFALLCRYFLEKES
jgi:cyanoexosortase A